jgi:uncharacterized protein YacL
LPCALGDTDERWERTRVADRLRMGEEPHDAALSVLSDEGGTLHESDRALTAADDRREPDRPAPAPRGLLVEFVRLIMVSLFALAGWQIANSTGPDRPTGILLGILMGSGVGYVLGGVFGRRTASAVSEFEREFRRIPAPELLAGGIGLLLGMILATLLSVPLFHLPPGGAYPTVAFMYGILAYAGYRIGRAKTDELFAVFGVKPRAAGARPGEVAVLDSSAILDGRIVPMVRMGFLSGTLLVSRSVLDEIQTVADSSDPVRRGRGRRALDVLVGLKRDPSVDVLLVDDEAGSGAETVDARIVRLARARGAVLVTNDNALASVAAALDVPVRSINALADALRPPVLPGERVPLRLVRRGRESGQAVGYLDDGTMVVVEEADHLLGDTVSISVTNALQTSTGRLVFARVADPD